MSEQARQRKQERLVQMLRAQARSYRAHIASLEAELAQLRGGGHPAANQSGRNTELENRLAAAGGAEPRRGFPVPDLTRRAEPRKQPNANLDQLLSAIGDT